MLKDELLKYSNRYFENAEKGQRLGLKSLESKKVHDS